MAKRQCYKEIFQFDGLDDGRLTISQTDEGVELAVGHSSPAFVVLSWEQWKTLRYTIPIYEPMEASNDPTE